MAQNNGKFRATTCSPVILRKGPGSAAQWFGGCVWQEKNSKPAKRTIVFWGGTMGLWKKVQAITHSDGDYTPKWMKQSEIRRSRSGLTGHARRDVYELAGAGACNEPQFCFGRRTKCLPTNAVTSIKTMPTQNRSSRPNVIKKNMPTITTMNELRRVPAAWLKKSRLIAEKKLVSHPISRSEHPGSNCILGSP